MSGAYDTDEIIIIQKGGFDSWNEPIAAPDIKVKGKIEYKTKLVRDLKGEEVISSAQIYLPESIDIALQRDLTHTDKLKFDGVKHSIINMSKPKAFSNYFVFKYEVYVK